MIYVSGHKNPDTDSVCAAYCYARFKNMVDPSGTYLPVRCGALNSQVKYLFRFLNLEPPVLLPDIFPKVKDVARRDPIKIEEDEPVRFAIDLLDSHNISVLPVFSSSGIFKGIVSIHEISQFLLSESSNHRPAYTFRPENFLKVFPGRCIKRGDFQEFQAPLMIGAMPYETSIRRIEALLPQKPLLVVGLREDLLQYALLKDLPTIVLTGVENPAHLPLDLSKYRGWIFISDIDTAETVRLLRLSIPVRCIMNPNPIQIDGEERFETARDILVNSQYRGLPVFLEGSFYGIVTRRCFIHRPTQRLILVDHNELSQSIPGAEHAEILEIIDHHRIAPEKTHKPIYMYVKPVGSTCTLIYEQFQIFHIPISREIAILLLGGILADTAHFRSPTTTNLDKEIASALARIGGVDVDSFGKELLSQAHDLLTADLSQIVQSDFKTYAESGIKFGIGQVEVVSFDSVKEVKDRLLAIMEETRQNQQLDWVLLMITNVPKESSLLLSTNHPKLERLLIFSKIDEHMYDLPGVLSRKKQLLPEILQVLESQSRSSA
ncbi:MAG: putative manganese-dependent inorganic diphosphatase [Spirochaetes bacterium]|nr:putative manganese-dependent inorganic diphosphatase [Spirochaetota bacterium]